MRAALVFDVEGTLLDPGALDAGERAVLQERVLVCAATSYRPYAALADAELLAALAALPPYPGVAAALQRLHDAGFALHALDNADQLILEAQLHGAGLARFFSSIRSAERGESYKPRAQAYRNLLAAIGARPEDAVMVSAHAWDVAGAEHAGMKTLHVTNGLADAADRLLYLPLTSGAVTTPSSRR